MWWFDSNKTKPNKTKNQAPSFLQIQVLILKACFPSTVALYEEMCGVLFLFLFFFNLFFVFLFFLEKIPKNEGNRKPRGAPVVWRRPQEVTWTISLQNYRGHTAFTHFQIYGFLAGLRNRTPIISIRLSAANLSLMRGSHTSQGWLLC